MQLIAKGRTVIEVRIGECCRSQKKKFGKLKYKLILEILTASENDNRRIVRNN